MTTAEEYRTRPTVYERDGVFYIRASALSRCQRSLAKALAEGEPEPTEAMRAAQRFGRMVEEQLVDWAIRTQGIGGSVSREVELRLDLPLKSSTGMPVAIEGHADAVVRGLRAQVIEAKTYSVSSSLSLSIARWQRQLAAYFHSVSAHEGVLVTEDRRSGVRNIYTYSYAGLPSVSDLAKWVEAVLTTPYTELPCECSYCDTVPIDVPEDTAVLIDLIGALGEEIKVLEKRREAAVQKLFQIAEREEWKRGDTYLGEEYAAVLVPEGIREKFDTKGHAKENPECHSRYTVSERRKAYIRVTPRKNGDSTDQQGSHPQKDR